MTFAEMVEELECALMASMAAPESALRSGCPQSDAVALQSAACAARLASKLGVKLPASQAPAKKSND